jgi:hypothetical protein
MAAFNTRRSRVLIVGAPTVLAVVLLASGCSATPKAAQSDALTTHTSIRDPISIDAAAGYGRVFAGGRAAWRPAIQIAWRNSQKLRNTKMLLSNQLRRPVLARIQVQVLNGQHQALTTDPLYTAHLRPAPAKTAIEMLGRRGTNSIFNQLDALDQSYCLAVTVQPLNVPAAEAKSTFGIKCYNNAVKLIPGIPATVPYVLRNRTPAPARVKALLNMTKLPAGWTVRPAAKDNWSAQILGPGQATSGWLTITAPRSTRNGTSIDLRPALLDLTTGAVLDGTEIFAAVDSTPPDVVSAWAQTAYLTGTAAQDSQTMSRLQNGYKANTSLANYNKNNVGHPEAGYYLYVMVYAKDEFAGLAEASGMEVSYSTDGGVTSSERTLAYIDGNFFGATSFCTYIGPVPLGTHLTLSIIARNVVGNVSETSTQAFTVSKAGETHRSYLNTADTGSW